MQDTRGLEFCASDFFWFQFGDEPQMEQCTVGCLHTFGQTVGCEFTELFEKHDDPDSGT